MSNQYGKIALVSGQQIRQDVGGTGLSGLVIGNESGLTCSVTLQGAGIKKTLYPGTVDAFRVPKGVSWNGNVQIDPTTDLNNVNSWPSSHIYIDTYGINEQIPNSYPLVLNRAGNIGNVVTTAMGGSTSLQNDGNAASTVYLEATQSGGPASNVSATADGSIQFNQWDGATKKNIFQIVANPSGSNPNIKMLTSGMIAEILGTLLIDNNLPLRYKDSGGAARDLLNVDGSNNAILHGITTNDQILLQNAAGTIQFVFDAVLGLLNIPGTKQTLNGDTSGTMDIYEAFSGKIKLVVVVQNNFRQAAAGIQVVTLKTAFTQFAFIVNAGCGGIVQATGGSVNQNNQITWGTGTSGGTSAANTQIPSDAAGFSFGSFTQVGDSGGYAGAHTGVGFYLGV